MLKHGDKKVNSNLRLVEKHLKEYGKITRKEAADLYDCYNLSAVIHALKAEGMKITNANKGRKISAYVLVATKPEPVIVKPEEFWAIVGFYKTTSGAISVHFGQTLFESEKEADAFGQMAKENDPEMISYDVTQMIRLVKEK